MDKTLFESRINKLRAFLKESTDAAVITDEVNIGYFCGFFHSEGVLLVTQEKTVLFVDFRYAQAAKEKACGCEVVCYKKLYEELLEILKSNNISNVYFEALKITVSRFNTFKKSLEKENIFCTADGKLDNEIESIRIIKDKSELDKLITAQKIAEKSYLEVLNYLKVGVSEREISARLEYFMKLNGAEDISFDLITITGKKTALPHGVPDDSTVAFGDFFTFDIGAIYEGYHSDTTRTVAVGNASDEMREIYSIVLRAQLAALDKIKAGELCSNIDKTARDIIKEAGYGECFGHSTGHGVGLDIHEAPFVSQASKTELKAGMVITDEPGIYIPEKFGVRIEDTVVVTENGCKNLVTLPKELIIL